MADGGHAHHDRLDVAAATDRGASLSRTLRLCAGCLYLHAQLMAVAAAVPLAAIPRRPRDYSLSAADAARLRAPGWRRLLDAFGSARDEVSRPLAATCATLGVVGLLLTGIQTMGPGGGSGPAIAIRDDPHKVMEFAPAAASAVPSIATDVLEPGDDIPTGAGIGRASSGPNPLLLVSGAFLGTGGVLFVGRALAKRRDVVR